MLDDAELDLLEAKCRTVPLTTSTYVASDYVATLLETVMDYQNTTRTVQRAGQHFERHRWDEIRTLEDLEAVMEGFPDDREGNTALAQYLWRYNHWRRAKELRGLAAYFRGLQVTTLQRVREWARTSTSSDFVGKVKGLGPTVYQWLVMRLGVETVKPDVHVLRFVRDAIGRPVNEAEAVAALEQVARRLGVRANLLDWSIWEHERSGG